MTHMIVVPFDYFYIRLSWIVRGKIKFWQIGSIGAGFSSLSFLYYEVNTLRLKEKNKVNIIIFDPFSFLLFYKM